ncbi:MAG: thioredoxin domain-containing protein [Candidatus Peregrinibacteria bacterium]|nr:thioredoxin domain-containing protein [Candidatus Peregrinibacteria bacterium]
MDNNEDVKSFTLWFLVGVILIGSFLAIMFMSKTPVATPGTLSKAVAADEWIKGQKDSKVTLVEYSDFQCPACRAWEPEIANIMSEFGTHIRLVYREFPLGAPLHPNSQMGAQAAEAAGIQGKFWEMHDLLFQNQSIWAPQGPDAVQSTLADYAKQLGLNMDQFNKDLNSDKVVKLVTEDKDSGTASGVNSTPTFFLNNKEIKPQSNDDFRKLIRGEIDSSS